MINFAILPVNFYDAKVNQTWDPKAWPAVSRDLNPYADSFIERIQLLTFNLRRQIQLRADHIRNAWLHRIGELDECVIQAEHDHFVHELERLEFIYREYIIDHYLDRESASFDPDNLRLDMVQPPEIPTTYQWPSILVDIITNSKDPYEIEPVATRSLARGELPKEVDGRYKVPNHVTRQHIEKQMKLSWEKLGPQAWRIAASFNHLLWEFASLKGEDILNGIAGKTRMMLVNEAIPLPNKYTWLAWYSLCGLNFQSIHPNRLAHIQSMVGDVDSILQFVLPSMPMTTEHVSGIPNPGDDSGSGHSLSSKSASHDRNLYGKIIHGRWESYTVCTNIKGDGAVPAIENLVIDDVAFGTTTGRSLIDSGLNMWGTPLTHPVFYPDAIGIVSDPYFRFMYRQQLHMHRLSRQSFDTGMRSLAEFHNVHLRFSGNEFGALCAVEWRDAFIAEALRFMNRTDNDQLVNEFDAALLRQQPRMIRSKGIRGRKVTHDFGIDEIFGTDS